MKVGCSDVKRLSGFVGFRIVSDDSLFRTLVQEYLLGGTYFELSCFAMICVGLGLGD